MAIAQVAGEQHRQITRAQLLAIGLNDDQIAYRVRVGRLYRVYRGVYSVGGPPRAPLERATAAVLACGPGAALSHGSALTLWGFREHWQTPYEVIAAVHRRPAGIDLHRSATLARRDLTRQHGIPVTSPARTILDNAPRLTDSALARVVNEGRHSTYLRLPALADLVERCPTHPGAARVIRCLTGLGRGGPTRSGSEDSFPAFCKRRNLPQPVMAAEVCGYEVDALFAAEKLIVELDGWEFHCDRHAFETDRLRDAITLAAGYGTVRITSERMHDTPDDEAARLHAILADRRRYLLSAES